MPDSTDAPARRTRGPTVDHQAAVRLGAGQGRRLVAGPHGLFQGLRDALHVCPALRQVELHDDAAPVAPVLLAAETGQREAQPPLASPDGPAALPHVQRAGRLAARSA